MRQKTARNLCVQCAVRQLEINIEHRSHGVRPVTLSCVCGVARRHLGSTFTSTSPLNGPGGDHTHTHTHSKLETWLETRQRGRGEPRQSSQPCSQQTRHSTRQSPDSRSQDSLQVLSLTHDTQGLVHPTDRSTGDRYRYTRGALRYTVSMFWHPLPNVCSRVSRLASRCGLGYPPSVSRASRHRDGRRRAR